MTNWSKDHVLSALQDLDDPLGSLIRAFPGRAAASNDEWLEGWFVRLVRSFQKGRGPDVKTIMASAVGDGDISALAKPPVRDAVRLQSLRASYFRGFRAAAIPISLNADLIVLEGRNSTGKTSVSEAIEWVLTGRLSRRESGQHGHPSELSNCIANEFRPDGQDTFVELCLQVNGTPTLLRRVLRKDYSRVAVDAPESSLYRDGKELDATEEADLLDRLFAGVHPILMQHNLRRFVHDEPHDRRQYFERLLQIDELTALIEKAVIGPTRIKQIGNPGGGTGLAALRALSAEVARAPGGASLAAALTKLERVKAADLPLQLEKGLLKVSVEYFAKDAGDATSLAQVRERLADAQRIQREARLPVLASFTAARAHEIADWRQIAAGIQALVGAASSLQEVVAGAAALTDAQREIARVTSELASKQLLDLSSQKDQMCPLCEDDRTTLTVLRLAQLASWSPLASAISAAQASVAGLNVEVAQSLASLRASLGVSIPSLPARKVIEQQLKGANPRVVALTGDAVSTAQLLDAGRTVVLKALDTLEQLVASPSPDPAALSEASRATDDALSSIHGVQVQHRECVAALEEAVGSASRDDAEYRLRDRWLDLAGLTASLSEDTAWESAKQGAKTALDTLRDGLIALRSQIIEHARETFSRNMTSVWKLLRSDSGAQFSRIYVPEARGKGYKLEFELKAMISDGSKTPEVDALRVFSESQVNVVGVAAYVTRARSLGHKILIFDDPVQSMDEEHFRTFACRLLTALLDEGFQVLILTHSDIFAKRLNECHFHRDSYVTLETRAGRRHGCQVGEGNRRVSERLKNAEKLASDGDLQGSWRLVRLAVERLYTLAYLRSDAEFDPAKWASMSAEDMWNQGAGAVCEQAVPGCTKELKAVLDMSAAGAHDKAATSETDVQNAVKYLRTLLSPLRVGAG